MWRQCNATCWSHYKSFFFLITQSLYIDMEMSNSVAVITLLDICICLLSWYQTNVTYGKHFSSLTVQSAIDNYIMGLMTNHMEWNSKKSAIMVLSFKYRCHHTQCNLNITPYIHIIANGNDIKYARYILLYVKLVWVACNIDYTKVISIILHTTNIRNSKQFKIFNSSNCRFYMQWRWKR